MNKFRKQEFSILISFGSNYNDRGCIVERKKREKIKENENCMKVLLFEKEKNNWMNILLVENERKKWMNVLLVKDKDSAGQLPSPCNHSWS